MSEETAIDSRIQGGLGPEPGSAANTSEYALFREIFEHSSDGIAVIDLNGRYLMQNAAHEALVGYGDEELARHTPAVHLGEETFALIAEALQRTGHYRGEARSRSKAGAERIVEISSFTVAGPDGEPLYYVGMKRDITERRLEEKELRRRYEQLQVLHRMTEAVSRATELEEIHEQALDCLQQGIGADRASVLRFDEAGVMRFVAWRGLSEGYRRAVDGHSPWTRETPDPQPITVADAGLDPEMSDELREVIVGEGIRALAFVPLLHQGDLLGKFMVYFNDPHEFQAEEVRFAHTVANHVAFAIARHLREASLRSANEAKSRFLATMSHELRTPLNAIMGYADLLDLGTAGELNPGQSQQLERIQSGARHLMSVIEEILTFSRVEAGKEKLRPEMVSVRELVEEAATMVRHAAAEKGLDFRVELPARAPDIETDRGKFRQVLLNLLGNAVKFTDRGEVSLAVESEGEGVVFRIGDTGVGIDPTHLQHIFEAFWQVDLGATRRTGGTGLGLAVTQHLVQLLGGRIDVESEPGRGSTFVVQLPARLPATD